MTQLEHRLKTEPPTKKVDTNEVSAIKKSTYTNIAKSANGIVTATFSIIGGPKTMSRKALKLNKNEQSTCQPTTKPKPKTSKK